MVSMDSIAYRQDVDYLVGDCVDPDDGDEESEIGEYPVKLRLLVQRSGEKDNHGKSDANNERNTPHRHRAKRIPQGNYLQTRRVDSNNQKNLIYLIKLHCIAAYL